MKREAVVIYVIGALIALFAMSFMPFCSFKGESLTMFEMLDYMGDYGRHSNDVNSVIWGCIGTFAFVCISLFVAIISLCVNTGNRALLVITSVISLISFICAGIISDDSGVGIYITLVSLIIMIISAFASGSSEDEPQAVKNPNTPQKAQEDSVKPIKKEDLFNYVAANKLSDAEIGELLTQRRSELNADYIVTLEFVQNDRSAQIDIEQERCASLSKALTLSSEELDERVGNPAIYSDLLVLASSYVKRCVECGIEATESGFLETFELGYVTPETPAERDVRLKKEEELRLLAQKKQEEEEAQRKRSKRNRRIFWLVAAIVALLFAFYKLEIHPQRVYDTLISQADEKVESGFVNQYDGAIRLYEESLNYLPLIGKGAKEKYAKDQINAVYLLIKENNERVAAEKARKEEEARQAKLKAEQLAIRKRNEFKQRMMSKYPSRVINGKFLVAKADIVTISEIDSYVGKIEHWSDAQGFAAGYSEPDAGLGKGAWSIPTKQEMKLICAQFERFGLQYYGIGDSPCYWTCSIDEYGNRTNMGLDWSRDKSKASWYEISIPGYMGSYLRCVRRL